MCRIERKQLMIMVDCDQHFFCWCWLIEKETKKLSRWKLGQGSYRNCSCSSPLSLPLLHSLVPSLSLSLSHTHCTWSTGVWLPQWTPYAPGRSDLITHPVPLGWYTHTPTFTSLMEGIRQQIPVTYNHHHHNSSCPKWTSLGFSFLTLILFQK